MPFSATRTILKKTKTRNSYSAIYEPTQDYRLAALCRLGNEHLMRAMNDCRLDIAISRLRPAIVPRRIHLRIARGTLCIRFQLEYPKSVSV